MRCSGSTSKVNTRAHAVARCAVARLLRLRLTQSVLIIYILSRESEALVLVRCRCRSAAAAAAAVSHVNARATTTTTMTRFDPQVLVIDKLVSSRYVLLVVDAFHRIITTVSADSVYNVGV